LPDLLCDHDLLPNDDLLHDLPTDGAGGESNDELLQPSRCGLGTNAGTATNAEHARSTDAAASSASARCRPDDRCRSGLHELWYDHGQLQCLLCAGPLWHSSGKLLNVQFLLHHGRCHHQRHHHNASCCRQQHL
jgi:hypothetical protein